MLKKKFLVYLFQDFYYKSTIMGIIIAIVKNSNNALKKLRNITL